MEMKLEDFNIWKSPQHRFAIMMRIEMPIMPTNCLVFIIRRILLLCSSRFMLCSLDIEIAFSLLYFSII